MTNSFSLDDDLTLALTIADEVSSFTMGHFLAGDFVVETKPDLTPVTEADRGAEDMIRTRLKDLRPADAFYGEERGSAGESKRRWIIDPIDGTKNFVRGVPVWATLIALSVDDEIVLGVASAPALQRRWWAVRGGGAWASSSFFEKKRLRVSSVGDMSHASLSVSSHRGWDRCGRGAQFLDLQSECWRTRAYGDFWSYMLVAEGAVDIACEPSLELYDMAALAPIVEEAGGRFTSLSGARGPWGPNALATNGRLHDQVLTRLDWPRDILRAHSEE